jgi:hypothetical protein
MTQVSGTAIGSGGQVNRLGEGTARKDALPRRDARPGDATGSGDAVSLSRRARQTVSAGAARQALGASAGSRPELSRDSAEALSRRVGDEILTHARQAARAQANSSRDAALLVLR